MDLPIDSVYTTPYSIGGVEHIEAAVLHRLPQTHRPGWAAPGCRAAARAEAAGAAPQARADPGELPRPRHAPRATRDSVASDRRRGARVPALPRPGLRAGRLPREPLLAPGRSRAPDR